MSKTLNRPADAFVEHSAIPISICVIAKNEAKNMGPFRKTVRELISHPKDEVVFVDTGSTDGTKALAKKYGWRVIEAPHLCTQRLATLGEKWLPKHWTDWKDQPHFDGGILESFSAARQISFDAAQNEICLWLDLDDSVENPQFLRPMIDWAFKDCTNGAIFLRYDYAHDPIDHAVTTTLFRERIVTKSTWMWKGLCHETILPRTDELRGTAKLVRDPACPIFVVHRNPKPHKFSDLRNYIVLRNDLESNKEYRDPRTLFYLGNACRGLGEHLEAIRWYMEFVKRSGSRDDIYSAWLSTIGAWCELNRPYKALTAANEAKRILPHDPRAYYSAANCWMKLENWANVIAEVKLGDCFPMRDTLHAVDPCGVYFQPAALAAIAAKELRLPDEAVQFAARAMEARNQLPLAREFLTDLRQWADAEKYGQDVMRVIQYAPDQNAAVQALRLPPHYVEFGMGEKEKVVYKPIEGNPTIAFWCGLSPEAWGPNSYKEGMGASEKMVILMASNLVSQGYNVTVYCACSTPNVIVNGVKWMHTANFNPDLYRDFLVIWRAPRILEAVPFRAGKIFVWMHDVGSNAWWTPPVLARIDKVMFLSQFQRSLHPAVPDDKVYITRNAIDFDLQIYKGEPRTKKIIYCSSPDRGMKTAIQQFKRSGLARLGYTLHLFYSFTKVFKINAMKQGYTFIPEEGLERNMYEYWDECMELCDGKTVIYRGRVGWDVLATEFKTAEIWFYPTKFDEISCVSAMEAMAAGCKVVATKYAALAETLAGYPLLYEVTDLSRAGEVLRQAADDAKYGEAEITAAMKYSARFNSLPLAREWAAQLFSKEAANEPRPDCDGSPAADGAK